MAKSETLTRMKVQGANDGVMFVEAKDGPWCHYRVAKRLLDAHAAERAALVAQLELRTLERDEARKTLQKRVENDAVYSARAEAREQELQTARDAHAALVAQLGAANGLLARAQDGSAKRPREANTDSVQLDYDIGKHLERNGWRWDAINRKWTQADTATWTEYRGRQP
jgi:hypothetical protein